MKQPKSPRYANIFERCIAATIDIFVLLFAIQLPILILAFVFKNSLASTLLSLLNVSLVLAYQVYFTAVTGQTLGKRLLKIKVVDKHSGKVPGIFNAFIRETVGKFFSTVVFGLGFVQIVRDPRAQSWHDKIVSTVVVKL